MGCACWDHTKGTVIKFFSLFAHRHTLVILAAYYIYVVLMLQLYYLLLHRFPNSLISSSRFRVRMRLTRAFVWIRHICQEFILEKLLVFSFERAVIQTYISFLFSAFSANTLIMVLSSWRSDCIISWLIFFIGGSSSR